MFFKFFSQNFFVIFVAITSACAPIVVQSSQDESENTQSEDKKPNNPDVSTGSEAKDVCTDPNHVTHPFSSASTSKKNEAEPIQESKRPSGSQLTRKDPPPRSQFAKSDYAELQKLVKWNSEDRDRNLDIEKSFRRLAEIYQFDDFRAVELDPMTEQDDKVTRILLLDYKLSHLAYVLNLLAGIAEAMHRGVKDSTTINYIDTLPIATALGKTIEIKLKPSYFDFIKYENKPLEGVAGEFWPEGRQIEFVFGKQTVVFLFSIACGKLGHSLEALKGDVIFQTPWILRALEGKPFKGLWQSSSWDDARQGSGRQHNLDLETRRRTYTSNLFEAIWDGRSLFVPGPAYAYRFIDKFEEVHFEENIYLFGIREFYLNTLLDFQSTIQQLSAQPGFTFARSCAPIVVKSSQDESEDTQSEDKNPKNNPNVSTGSEIKKDTCLLKEDKDVCADPNHVTHPFSSASTSKKNEAEPIQESKRPSGSQLTRKDPPPRSQFAKSDYAELQKLVKWNSEDRDHNLDIEKSFRRIAEIYQFDGFRAVELDPMSEQDDKVTRILLLDYELSHLEYVLNLLAGIAEAMHRGVKDSTTINYIDTLPIATVLKNTIEIKLKPSYFDFIKYENKALEGMAGEFWPEGRQIEFVFGKQTVVFLFSIACGKLGHSLEALKGDVVFQTPWILRALEGKPFKGLWQSSSRDDARQGSGRQHDLDLETRRRTYTSNLFEKIWDGRSLFFPGPAYASRFIGSFKFYHHEENMYLFGIREFHLNTLLDFQSTIRQLSVQSGFTFKNTIHK